MLGDAHIRHHKWVNIHSGYDRCRILLSLCSYDGADFEPAMPSFQAEKRVIAMATTIPCERKAEFQA